MRSSDRAYDELKAIDMRISEQRQAVAAKAYLAAIVDSADDAILSKDLNGVIQR